MREDLPTLLRPMKHTWEHAQGLRVIHWSGCWGESRCVSVWSRWLNILISSRSVTTCSDWMLPFRHTAVRKAAKSRRTRLRLIHLPDTMTDRWRPTLPASYEYIIPRRGRVVANWACQKRPPQSNQHNVPFVTPQWTPLSIKGYKWGRLLCMRLAGRCIFPSQRLCFRLRKS